MRITNRNLQRIIREEYSRLKRRGLIKESAVWQYNREMGEDGQDCEEGTSIEECAATWVQSTIDSYGEDVIYEIGDFVRPSSRGGGIDIVEMSRDDSDAGDALSECLEGMDIRGSGNWDKNLAANALADAFLDIYHA